MNNVSNNFRKDVAWYILLIPSKGTIAFRGAYFSNNFKNFKPV